MLALLLVFLLIPFKYTCYGEKLEDTFLEGSVSWLFGGLKMRFNYSTDNGINMAMNILGFKKKLSNKKESLKRLDKKHESDNSKKSEKPVYSYFTYGVFKQALQSVLKILDHCKPRQFCVNAKVGFDDPMYTGLLCGIKGYAILDKYNIRLEPTFEEELLQGNFRLGGSIQFFYLLLIAIGFVFTTPFRSILFKNIKMKIKRRLKKWRIISISARV
jgi:hypothetical protein